MGASSGIARRNVSDDFIDWKNRWRAEVDMAGDGNANARIRGRQPPHGEPVLDRAFRILGSFGPDDRSLTLTSLSARAALPAPSALRIARRLVELGALERDEDGRYSVGLRLLEIASLAPRGHGLRGTALPYLEDLHHATGQHVLLAVRDGHEAILVERLSAHRAGRVLYRIGGRMPMHATGVGLVLLAHAPVQVQDEVLAGDLTVEPGHPLQSEHELRVRLAAVRRDGVAVASRKQPEPMTSVAAPVLNNGRVVAALSVVAQSGNLQPTALTPAVVAVARAVSRAVSAASARNR
jgi:DNA-binding IclR family transcriptional regulator